MKNSIALYLIAILLAFSCVPKAEKEKLEMENEELKAELTRAQMAVSTLEEVGNLIDSIDKARDALKFDLESGTDYDDYLKRMEDINNYVRDTQNKLSQLEQELDKSSTNSRAYTRTISRLKNELAAKSQEIAQLQNTVENYKTENVELLKIVNVRESQIMALEDDISIKLEELNLLENRMQEIMKAAQVSDGDSYFALGEALEEAAKRTKLAPKKRKESYSEAMEYYKKALSFGREDAQAKIEELEKKI